MKRKIDSWYSPNLKRKWEIASYGDSGVPILLFPTAAADYLEYERFLLLDAIAPSVKGGKVRLFSINSINADSWLNNKVHPKYKGIVQQAYNRYVCDEVVPYIRHQCNGPVGIVTAGASLGAFHAANQLFRRPDLFDGTIAMSGVYDIRKYYDARGYHDENIYFNNPIEFLPGLNDDRYLPMLQKKERIYLLTGQGPYESPDASRHLSRILTAKGIPHKLDIWGYDVSHDWPTWRAMMEFYIATRF